MMTLSKALGAGQAKAYFQSEYTNTQESYYSEGETVKGKWFGKQAENWNLKGDVQEEHFERLCEGQHPRTGEQLVRHVTRHKYENGYGEMVENSEHRAGFDATFSAPKSVSLAALVGGDERILAAHDRSVGVALNELEKYIQARIGGNHPAQTTGKMLAARFQHDSARPERNTGYAAPQLHTHTVIFNITETLDGRIKPVQPLELYRSQRYATEIYRSVLATELQKLGYEVTVDARTGAPEINGFSKEYLEASSPRREELRREAAAMKSRLAQQGIQVRDGAGLRQAAAKTDRMSKQFNREEMRSRHLEMEVRFGDQAIRAVEATQVRGAVMLPEEQIKSRARESIRFARENAGEREAVVDKRKVLIDALRRNLGLTTYEAVVDDFARNLENGSFIRITRNPGIDEVTTSKTVAMEQSNIRTVLAGKATQTAIIEREQLPSVLQNITRREGIVLNERQHEAVETVLGSHDRIMGLEGLAGTGKTTTLSVLREAAERGGYVVQGFAPTGAAADVLAESGIRSSTLQKFVATSQFNCAAGEKVLYIIDESSLSDTHNMFRFFEKAGPSARVLLVGDSGQHQAVEAGAPFEQFVKAGMQTATLDEIVRQRSDLRKPVEQLAKRDVLGAVKTLSEQRRVTEIVGDEERLRAIAADYVSSPKRTLVISPANQERVAINSIIHQELQTRGVIGTSDHDTRVLVIRQDMTGAERKFAFSYVPQEDIVRYNKASKVFGIKEGEYGRVLATSHADNKLTIELQDGRTINYNPKRLSGVSVYKEAQRQFSVGDRIQFRAPFMEAKVKNSELGTIIAIEQGDFSVSLNGERVITFNPERFPHIDHGYAVTSYSAQGKTMDRVLVNAETTETDLLLNQRMAYVAVSRARLDARIYTDCAADLGGALNRRRDKTMALEALTQSQGQENRDSNELSVHPGKPSENIVAINSAEDDEPHSLSRLKARSLLADSDVAVAQKRLAEFEKSKHLYSFEIDGERWSLLRVNRHEQSKEHQIEYDKRTVSAYRMRLYGAINNPLKFYGIGQYKEDATHAKHRIKHTRQQLEELQEVRQTLNSYLRNHKRELQSDLQSQKEFAQELDHALEAKVDLTGKGREELPLPEFTEKELNHLEENARSLRDWKMLQTVYHHLERGYGKTAEGMERLTIRAGETLESAKLSLANVDERIETFLENRELFPLSFRTANGEERTATLKEIGSKSRWQTAFGGSSVRTDRDAFAEALNQHQTDLLQERNNTQKFLTAANGIVETYRQNLINLNLSAGQAAAIDRRDISAAALGNVGPQNHGELANLNDPTSQHTMKMNPTQATIDEHLKQLRQTVDSISAQTGTTVKSAIDAAIPEAESAASESLAALI